MASILKSRCSGLTWIFLLVCSIYAPALLFAGECPLSVGYTGFGDANRMTRDIAIQGERAYTADRFGMTIYDISDPQQPLRLGSVFLPGSGISVSVQGLIAYVGADNSGLAVIDISDDSHPNLLSSIGIMSLASVVDQSILYVIGGWELHIFDLSAPASPTEIGQLYFGSYGRDIAVDSGRAYVARSQHGMEMIDVSDPSSPVSLATLTLPGRTIGIDAVGGIACAVGSTLQLHVLDVGDPENIHLLASVDTKGFPMDVLCYNDKAYVAGFGPLMTFDLSDPSLPAMLSAMELPGPAYFLFLSGNHLYLPNDDSGFEIINVADPDSPTLLGVAHAEGYAWNVTIDENLAYVADYNYGLQIFDISDPLAPLRIGDARLPGIAWSVTLDGKKAYVGDDEAGLMILDVQDPTSPELLGYYDSDGQAEQALISGNLAYLADGYRGIDIIDISRPDQPLLLGSCDTPPRGYAQGLARAGNVLWVADYYADLYAVDVSDPANPHILGEPLTDFSAGSYALALSGDFAYVLSSNRFRFEIWDISDPARPVQLSFIESPYWSSIPRGIAVQGDYAIITTEGRELHFLSISNPLQPRIISSASTLRRARNLAIDPDHHVAWIPEGPILEAVEIGCPSCETLDVLVANPEIPTGGAQTTVEVEVHDALGLPAPGEIVEGRSELGTLSDFTDLGDGRYTATLTSGERSGPDRIRVSINGELCTREAVVDFQCASGGPDHAAELLAAPQGESAILLSWAPVNGAESYRVLRDGMEIALLEPGASEYLDEALAPGTEYRYQLISSDQCEGGPISSEITARTSGIPPLCPGSAGLVGINFFTSSQEFVVADGLAFVPHYAGFRVLDISDLSAPVEIARYQNEDVGDVYALAYSDGILYAIGWTFSTFDLSDPTNPQRLGGIFWPKGYYPRITLTERTAYVGDSEGFWSVDISDPAQPQILGGWTDGDAVFSILVCEDVAYVGSDWKGESILDISDPSQPVLLDPLFPRGFLHEMVSQADYLYAAVGGKLYVLDASDRRSPRIVSSIEIPGAADMTSFGGGAYLALAGYELLSIVDITDPVAPRLVDTMDYPGLLPGQIEALGNSLMISNDHDTLQILTTECRSPRAAFEYDEESAQTAFFDRSLYDPKRWQWDFGDGAVSNEENPTHSYPGPGLYDVDLSVSNEFGSDRIIRRISIGSALFFDDFESGDTRLWSWTAN